jgi:uncharacterized membrane protein YdcZ (DUF606 family)
MLSTGSELLLAILGAFIVSLMADAFGWFE